MASDGGGLGDSPWKAEGTSPPWMEICSIFFLSSHKWPEFENIQNPVEGLNIFGALVALLPEYHPALEIFISCHW